MCVVCPQSGAAVMNEKVKKTKNVANVNDDFSLGHTGQFVASKVRGGVAVVVAGLRCKGAVRHARFVAAKVWGGGGDCNGRATMRRSCTARAQRT